MNRMMESWNSQHRCDRVLFVSSFSPLSAMSGAAIRAQQMLRFLSSRYLVDVVFEGEDDRPEELLLLRLGDVVTVPRLPRWRRLMAPFSVLPHHHAGMNQKAFANSFRRLADDREYAFAWMVKTWLFPAIRQVFPRTPVLLEQQAAERDVWENLARNDPRWPVRFYSRWNGVKVLAYERGMYQNLAGAISMSAADAEITREAYPPVPIIVVPVGVDCSYYRPSAVDPDPFVLLFSGGDATRNVQAVRRFVERIAPRLRQADQRYHLLWIGRVAVAHHDFLPDVSVTLTGYVKHVQEHFDKGAIFVAPFDMGEGVKVKIVEALAMGKLIVSTRVGIRGLSIDGKPFVRVADDDEGFARAVLDFSRDPRRQELSKQARCYAEEHLDCTKVTAALPAFIEGALASHRLRMSSDASS